MPLQVHTASVMTRRGCAQGMEREAVQQQADSLLAQVGLTADAATRTGRFSGGMRRRLSVAIALLGAPNTRVW